MTKDPQRTPPTSTDAELDELAAITPEDIARAQQAWRKDASPEYRDLLDARPADAPPATE